MSTARKKVRSLIMMPRIYNTENYRVKLATVHFWLVLAGQFIYSVTMWTIGIRQGALRQAMDRDRSLEYSNFIQTLTLK